MSTQGLLLGVRVEGHQAAERRNEFPEFQNQIIAALRDFDQIMGTAHTTAIAAINNPGNDLAVIRSQDASHFDRNVLQARLALTNRTISLLAQISQHADT